MLHKISNSIIIHIMFQQNNEQINNKLKYFGNRKYRCPCRYDPKLIISKEVQWHTQSYQMSKIYKLSFLSSF